MVEINKYEFLKSNEGLIRKFASKYYFDTPKFSFDDLVQVGNQAAVRALDSFDPTRNVKPTTYVSWAIDRDIQEFVGSNKHDIHLTNYAQRKAHKEGKDSSEYDKKYTAIRMDWDWQSSPGEDSLDWNEVLPSGSPPPEQKMVIDEQREILLGEINRLPPRQQRVILGKFFGDETYVSLGAELGVTKQRAKQIEQKAFATLKSRLSGRLDGFIARSDGLARRAK